MTREHKLSLILGFAVVLVVGVLLSDHLSGARQAQLEHADPASTLALAEPAPATSRSPSLVLVDPQGRPVDLKPQVAEPAPSLAMAPQSAEPAPGPFADATMFRPVDAPAEATSPSGGSGVQWLKEQLAGTMNDLVNGSGPQPAAAVDSVPTLKMTAAPSATARDTPRAAGLTYTVRPKDSLWSIAERTLGDGFRHKELAELNKDRLGPNGELRVGATLRLPADAKIAETPAPAARTAETRAPATKGMTTYTVKPGDTLGEISLKLLGTSKRYREIIGANRDQLDDADDLRAGMKLKIPAR